MAKHLIETHQNHLGETDTQSCILCSQCLAHPSWSGRELDVYQADDDAECEECGK